MKHRARVPLSEQGNGAVAATGWRWDSHSKARLHSRSSHRSSDNPSASDEGEGVGEAAPGVGVKRETFDLKSNKGATSATRLINFKRVRVRGGGKRRWAERRRRRVSSVWLWPDRSPEWSLSWEGVDSDLGQVVAMLSPLLLIGDGAELGMRPAVGNLDPVVDASPASRLCSALKKKKRKTRRMQEKSAWVGWSGVFVAASHTLEPGTWSRGGRRGNHTRVGGLAKKEKERTKEEVFSEGMAFGVRVSVREDVEAVGSKREGERGYVAERQNDRGFFYFCLFLTTDFAGTHSFGC